MTEPRGRGPWASVLRAEVDTGVAGKYDTGDVVDEDDELGAHG